MELIIFFLAFYFALTLKDKVIFYFKGRKALKSFKEILTGEFEIFNFCEMVHIKTNIGKIQIMEKSIKIFNSEGYFSLYIFEDEKFFKSLQSDMRTFIEKKKFIKKLKISTTY